MSRDLEPADPDLGEGPSDSRFLLAELIASSQDVYILTDLDGKVLHANHESPDPRMFTDLVRQQMPRSAASASPARWRGEVTVVVDEDSRTFDVEVINGKSKVAIHGRDVSSHVRLQQQLSHLASHDSLTDLPNRTLLMRRLADAVERSQNRQSSFAILYVDIDDLKRVNDTVGHEGGDELIAEIARRLLAATRPGDLVARIGGDEFVILCENIADETSASDLADRVRTAATGTISTSRTEIDSSVSVGVVLYSGLDGIQPASEVAQSLLNEADKAMYRAKLRGKSRCQIYTESMRTADRARARLAKDLEFAIERDQLFVEYQAIVSPYTKRAVAAEALVRWRHPEFGLLLPSVFIDLADDPAAGNPEIGASIGRWVLRRAMDDLRRWIDDARVDGRFAVSLNVSSAQVMRPDFAETTLGSMSEVGLKPFNIVLEFTEGIVLGLENGARRTLQSLRRRGVRLSLDDFGTGMSSITSLRSCPVDFVKLDGALVRGIGETENDERLLRSMVLLAHGIEASVIAESVTSSVQVERLMALGCDLMQGFHIAEPVPASDFVAGTATVFPA